MPKKPLFLRYYGHIFIGLLPALGHILEIFLRLKESG